MGSLMYLIFKFRPFVQEEALFKDIFRFLTLADILSSGVNLGRGHYEEHSCEIISNLD